LRFDEKLQTGEAVHVSHFVSYDSWQNPCGIDSEGPPSYDLRGGTLMLH